jgi:hypothetical protein
LTRQDHRAPDPDRFEDNMVRLQPRSKSVLAWGLWLATFGCCAAGLVVTLAVTRPLTVGVLAEGAIYALAFPLGYATVGLVLGLRRPANPIGWLYAGSGLCWSSIIPLAPWVDLLFREHRPLPLVAQLDAMASELVWAPAIAFGVTLPVLLLPTGGCARVAGGWWWSPPWPGTSCSWAPACSRERRARPRSRSATR